MKNIKMFDLRYLFGGAAIVSAMLSLAACGSSAEENRSETVGTVEIVDSGNAEEAISGGLVGVLNLENDSYDFGKVAEGTMIEHVFTFTNTGDAPLIISQVSASCGCTTPEYSTHPIIPGQEGTVKVVFDSNGQVGQQHKVISVLSNGSAKVTLLHLRGEVTPKS